MNENEQVNEPMNEQKSSKSWVALGVAVILIAGGAAYYYFARVPLQTYTNEKNQYSMEYPENWTKEEGTKVLADLQAEAVKVNAEQKDKERALELNKEIGRLSQWFVNSVDPTPPIPTLSSSVFAGDEFYEGFSSEIIKSFPPTQTLKSKELIKIDDTNVIYSIISDTLGKDLEENLTPDLNSRSLILYGEKDKSLLLSLISLKINKYSKTLRTIVRTDDVGFISPREEAKLVVRVITMPREANLEMIANLLISVIEDDPLLDLSESGQTKLADETPAYKAVFTKKGEGDNPGEKAMVVWTVKDDKLFEFTYAANENKYSKFLKTAQRMMDSFPSPESTDK